MSESQAADARRQWRSEAAKRRLTALFSAALVGGARHAAYLRELGMPADRIFLGYDVVDNAYFASGAGQARAEAAARRRLDLPESFFLATGRFVEKKNWLRLLEAFARFHALPPARGWKLVLLGDGPLKPAILELAAKLDLKDALLLPGFIQYDRLPLYYGLASAFVHASVVEQWGLVVNEAMAAGLPVLVSSRCGCVPELVRQGENGFTFDPLDTEALASLMARVAASAELRQSMSAASRRVVSEWPLERFAEGLEAAVAAAEPRRPGWADAALLRLLQMRPRSVREPAPSPP
jgi:glycosyltransferase involved in cell wall biosynthesis